jgi:uncharacterized protein
MDLSLDHPDGYLFVRRVDVDHIVVVDRKLHKSFLLSPGEAIENWLIDDARTLDASDVAFLLALQPELVILGTGQRQIFPAAAFLAGFLRQQIGVEVMDNAAAARTYNLLAGEGRRVVAGFILPSKSKDGQGG